MKEFKSTSVIMKYDEKSKFFHYTYIAADTLKVKQSHILYLPLDNVRQLLLQHTWIYLRHVFPDTKEIKELQLMCTGDERLLVWEILSQWFTRQE